MAESTTTSTGTGRAEIILHPVRMRIIQALAAGEGSRRLSARQLATLLPDVSQASLYRHLGRLTRAGVLRVAQVRQVRGQAERAYALAGVDLQYDELSALSREEHLQYFGVFLGMLLGDFARYLERDHVDLEADGVGYRQYPLYLSDQEFFALRRALDAALRPALANGPAPGRRRRVLTRIMLPADEPELPEGPDEPDEQEVAS